MKPRYRIFRRGSTFYKRNVETGQRTSLHTSSRERAQKSVDAENQSFESPALGHELAKAYLSTGDPLAKERIWQDVMDEYARKGAPKSKPLLVALKFKLRLTGQICTRDRRRQMTLDVLRHKAVAIEMTNKRAHP